ncbi:MAG: hypothetical protein ACI8XX_001932 [Polaribacter sp.]|jgi:hypothetical protein
MKNLFTEHPNTVGESYFEHLFAAAHFSAKLLLAGIVCLVHALLHFLFVKTGNQLVSQLYQRMVTQRDQRTAVTPDNY